MGKIKDLRSYISVLEKEGRFKNVDQPDDLVHELANVAATLARMQGNGVIFNHVKEALGSMPSRCPIRRRRFAVNRSVAPGQARWLLVKTRA